MRTRRLTPEKRLLRCRIQNWPTGARRSPRLRGNFAVVGQGGNAVGRAVGQRLDGHGGLATARGDEAAAVAEEKILYVVGAMVGVDDRSFRIVPHSAGTKQEHPQPLLFTQQAPLRFAPAPPP